MPVNYVLGLASWQRPNKVGVMIGVDSHARKKQVSFIGSHRCAHCHGASRLADGRHHRSGRKLLMPGMFVGTGWPRWREGRGEEGRGRHGAQTTWITGLKGRPDRVNLNNSEQKTASLLTSPLLHFHWQLSNKHTLSSKTFKRSFSSGFSTKLRVFFMLFALQSEKRVDENTQKHQK